jgi:hypothetical protein
MGVSAMYGSYCPPTCRDITAGSDVKPAMLDRHQAHLLAQR